MRGRPNLARVTEHAAESRADALDKYERTEFLPPFTTVARAITDAVAQNA